MVSLDKICRFCLINTESDCHKLLIQLTDLQKCKFEELTGSEVKKSRIQFNDIC